MGTVQVVSADRSPVMRGGQGRGLPRLAGACIIESLGDTLPANTCAEPSRRFVAKGAEPCANIGGK